MSWLRRLLDRIHPYVAKGGPYESLYVLYEAVDTFYVRDDHGRPLDEQQLARVEEQLTTVIAR